MMMEASCEPGPGNPVVLPFGKSGDRGAKGRLVIDVEDANLVGRATRISVRRDIPRVNPDLHVDSRDRPEPPSVRARPLLTAGKNYHPVGCRY